MALEVMATNEALLAMVASELTISEMCLDMRFNVLFPAKLLAAVDISAHVLAVNWIWSFDELCNVIDRNVGVLNRSFDARLEVQISD